MERWRPGGESQIIVMFPLQRLEVYKSKEFSSFSMFSLVTARNDSEQRLPPLVNGNACPGETLCRSRIQGFFELEITRPKIQKLRLGARRQNVPIPKTF